MLTRERTKEAAALIAEHWQAGGQIGALPERVSSGKQGPTAMLFKLIWKA